MSMIDGYELDDLYKELESLRAEVGIERINVHQRHSAWKLTLATHHWLSEIKCNHSAKTDVASCACGWSDPTPRLTVGTAVKSWIAHVETIVLATLPVDADIDAPPAKNQPKRR